MTGTLLLLSVAAAGFVLIAAFVYALLLVAGILLLQWRDLFSIDRWGEVFETLRRNKLRTALTMISVAWGIFVLVFLLGLGRGFDNGLRKTFARDATNGVWITANKTSVAHDGYDVGRRIVFDNRDYDQAAPVKLPGVGAPGVEHVSGQYFIRGGQFGGGDMLTRRNGKANAFQINAVHPDAIYLNANTIIAGRYLDLIDIVQRRKSAVIGRPVQDFLFGAENPIGQWINVAGVPFQVVGVFGDDGGADQERQIYIPVTTAQLAFNGGDRLHMLQFTVDTNDVEESKAISDRVVAQLAERHQFDPKDPQAVRVRNSIEQAQMFSKLFWMISTFVIVIGLGTLAAGVVGVSNIMLIAVKERTKEIGVRKALGATPRSIIAMVIQEAVFLTGVAGLIGLAAGVGLLSVTASYVETEFMRNPSINFGAGIGAAIGLMIAGSLAGFFPARAAARINPIAALRDQA